jgi:hypothetical protein
MLQPAAIHSHRSHGQKVLPGISSIASKSKDKSTKLLFAVAQQSGSIKVAHILKTITEQVLSGGWYQWEWGGYKERVKEGQCGGNIMYSCMKMEK